MIEVNGNVVTGILEVSGYIRNLDDGSMDGEELTRTAAQEVDRAMVRTPFGIDGKAQVS